MSLLFDKQVDTLNDLGLTYLQARTYLNLAKIGEADIKTIAFTAKVARQDTYRILESLEKMGLAQRVIAKTTMYSATPIQEGLSLLLQKKKKQLNKVEEEVFTEFHNFPEKRVTEIGLSKLSIISDFALLVNIHEKMSNSAKRTIDAILPLKLHQPSFLSHFQSFRRAIERGIKIRVIAQKPITFTNSIQTSPNGLELRYLPVNCPIFGMHIFDKRVVTLAVEDNKNLPSLITDSPHIIKISSIYFNNQWETATN
jgi:sugar-specific transcriptional regulator TrmB